MSLEAANDSKTRLLQAALRRVRTTGYAGSTVEDLCQAAGVTKGSFFHHFRTKDDLALSAIAHWETLTERLFASADYHALPDPRDRVLGYVALRAAMLEGEIPDFTCFLGTLVQETHLTHPALREACDRSLRRHVHALTADLEAARARYAPGATWTAGSLGFHIQSVLQGAFIFAKAQQDPAVIRHDLAHLTRYLHSLFDSTHQSPRGNSMTTTSDIGVQRYQTYIHAAPERVWDALTRPEFSVRYGYAPVVEYGNAPGAAYKAYPNEGMKAVPSVPAVICDGEILEWQPPRRLVQTFRMLMEPSLAAEGFTHLSYEIEAVRGGVSKLTVTHDVSRAPQLASVVAGRYEHRGAGGGWLEIVSGLKTLLETGDSLPFQSGPAPDPSCSSPVSPETAMTADEQKTTTRVEGNDLVLTRVIAASPEKIYAAWTQPELLTQWFVPKPWTIASAQLDVRVGGISHVVMRGPDGHEFPAPGVYLEVVKNRRLVFTDAYSEAWKPSGKAFMTASVDLEDLGGGRTRYTARARHWSQEDREAHEKMGFHEGWSICAEQLAELVETRA